MFSAEQGRYEEEGWYYDGRALNVMDAMYKHINFTFPIFYSPSFGETYFVKTFT